MTLHVTKPKPQLPYSMLTQIEKANKLLTQYLMVLGQMREHGDYPVPPPGTAFEDITKLHRTWIDDTVLYACGMGERAGEKKR